MDGKLIARMDKRKKSHGLTVGQRVKLVIGGHEGTVIGFGPAWEPGNVTVFTKLDDAPGNQGTHHTCGRVWVEAA